MLIVEELYLLLTKAEGTQERPGTPRAYGLVAAVVTDLIVAERVALTEEKRPRVMVALNQATGHPVLDTALALIGQKDGRRLESLVTWGKLDPEAQVVDSLVRAGVLEMGDRTFLGLGRPRTPEANAGPEQMLRARLAAVLAGQAWPTAADATLLSVLQALGIARPILAAESGGMKARELKHRINEVVAASPAGTAVERAVQAMNTVIVTAAIMPAIAAGGAAGS